MNGNLSNEHEYCSQNGTPHEYFREEFMKHRLRNLLCVLLLALLVGGLALKWVGQPAHAQVNAPGTPVSAAPPSAGSGVAAAGRLQPVAVDAVRVQDLRVVVHAIGTIAPSQAVTVRSRVDGELKALHFAEGQMVRAGQLLAEIDPRPFQHALAQAQATLARDRSLLESAERDLQRYRGLLEKDAIARQQVESQTTAVEQLQATVRGGQAQVDAAALQLSFTRITAPISGLAGLRNVDVGNVVRSSDGNGLLTLRQVQPAHAHFSVPEQHVPRIRGQRAQGGDIGVEAWDRDQRTLLAAGRVVATDNAIDPATGTLRLKAKFDNADARLFANQFVNLRLQLETVSGALVVPQSALMRSGQIAYVFVVNDDGVVAIRPVRPGESDGEWVAVQGELRAGQRVVVDGTDRLREGTRVEALSRTRSLALEIPAIASSPAARPVLPQASPSAAASAPLRSASAAAVMPRVAPASPARPPSASSTGQDSFPAWVRRLPPEEAGKVMKLSAEERQSYLRKQVKARADQEADAMAGSNPPDWFRQLPAESRERLLSLSPEQRRGWLFKRMMERAEQ